MNRCGADSLGFSVFGLLPHFSLRVLQYSWFSFLLSASSFHLQIDCCSSEFEIRSAKLSKA
jgi:hypothetical protein